MPEEIKAEEEKNLKKLYVLCWRCRGNKKYTLPLGDVPCEYCKETGMQLWGYIEK
jgi:hypothetical protein